MGRRRRASLPPTCPAGSPSGPRGVVELARPSQGSQAGQKRWIGNDCQARTGSLFHLAPMGGPAQNLQAPSASEYSKVDSANMAHHQARHRLLEPPTHSGTGRRHFKFAGASVRATRNICIPSRPNRRKSNGLGWGRNLSSHTARRTRHLLGTDCQFIRLGTIARASPKAGRSLGVVYALPLPRPPAHHNRPPPVACPAHCLARPASRRPPPLLPTYPNWPAPGRGQFGRLKRRPSIVDELPLFGRPA